jgi:hypothetical protein
MTKQYCIEDCIEELIEAANEDPLIVESGYDDLMKAAAEHLEGLRLMVTNAKDALYNPFEHDNQSRIWRELKECLEERI